MAAAILEFVVCAAIIVAAGTALTRFGDAIADLTKLGRLLVGSILMAGATSLPELTVDISAVAIEGLPDLAVGDLLGSSLFNLMILALADLAHRSRGKMFSRASAAHALSATMSIALTALAGMAILVGQKVELAFIGIGIGAWAILITYVLGARIIYYDQQYAASHATPGTQEVLQPAGKLSLRGAIIGYLVAAAVIFVVGPFLAQAAGELARLSGLGDTFVGTTLVALSTSLPELVATFTAVRMGAFDLALGNIFGSNAFNMILLVPLDVVYPGALLASVSATHVVTALATILVTSVAIIGQLYQVEKRKRLVEPDALLVLLLVIGSLALIYYLG